MIAMLKTALFGAAWLVWVAMALARPCSPVTGAELAIQSGKRFLVFGETHGTVEMPKAFAEIVCAIAPKRAVVVTVEYPVDETDAFATYLASKGGPGDRAKLFEDARWAQGKQDGRKSQAIFGMLQRLRALRAGGAKIDIATHLKMRPKSAADHEAGMAEGLVAIAKRFPAAQIVTLVGNAHAIRVRGAGGAAFPPMAAQLPEGQVYSVIFTGPAGTAWVCKSGGEMTVVCGEHDIPGRIRTASPALLLEKLGYDLQIELGSTTASPPAFRTPL